ncbi:hypothetical protein BZA05DRAFT_454582 [Tricharina praecox]|uniref:uncharacterized protein n=1 Tax=Tricharina praecox TaxID=43433 RepID=UPI00222085C5|nr:uncharacterized protein BZA05DRAFT_454582 [Tricharina praecox]KAI5849730.1 hypothetical protein BZA05DRAFT_454582 [Tricharina praecox]
MAIQDFDRWLQYMMLSSLLVVQVVPGSQSVAQATARRHHSPWESNNTLTTPGTPNPHTSTLNTTPAPTPNYPITQSTTTTSTPAPPPSPSPPYTNARPPTYPIMVPSRISSIPHPVAPLGTQRTSTSSPGDDFLGASSPILVAPPPPLTHGGKRKRTLHPEVYADADDDARGAAEEGVHVLATLSHDDSRLQVPRPAKRGQNPRNVRHSAPELVPTPGPGGGEEEGEEEGAAAAAGRKAKRARQSAPEVVVSPVEDGEEGEEEGEGKDGEDEEDEEEGKEPKERPLSRLERELQQAKQAERARQRNKWVFAQVELRLQQLKGLERRKSQRFENPKRQTRESAARRASAERRHTLDSTTRSSSAEVEVVHVEGFGERRNKAEVELEEEDVDDYGVLKDRPWSEEETTAVVMGMDKFRAGEDRWNQIKLEHPQVLRRRTPADCLEKAIEIRRVVRDELGIRLGSKWENF